MLLIGGRALDTTPTVIKRQQIGMLQSAQRRTVSGMQRRVAAFADRNEIPSPTTPGTIGKCEMDTHADTCCAGANCIPLYFTGEVCEVAGFTPDVGRIKDVPVATVCTVWTSPETGLEYLLIMAQVLWFGTKLENSLINPNQMRYHGMRVSDDPTDKERPFGIDLDDDPTVDDVLSFQTTGTTIYFNSRAPTEREIMELPRLQLTGDEPWDPVNVSI